MKFEPHYSDFQKDIERYLRSRGNCEKLNDGTIKYSGYEDALSEMFQTYIRQRALAPLVTHFRRWNWELSYNDYLLRLSDQLLIARDWKNLRDLWNGVLAKRKAHYNKVWKIEKDSPGKLPTQTIQDCKARLLDTLGRLLSFSRDFGATAKLVEYEQTVAKVEAGRKA